MGFRTIIVNTHSKLSYKNNHLIFRTAERTELIHISEIDILICETTDIALTTMLLNQLIDEGVLVIFSDAKRLPNSILMPYYGRHDASLQIQNQISWKVQTKEKIWTDVITQKINNQAQILRNNGIYEKADNITLAIKNLQTNDPSNVEGHTARIYFNALFGNSFARDDGSEVNKALDYGYTLLMSMFAREVVKCGCLTQLGIKHANQFNQFNLASDLMEPFRCIVDEIVYKNREDSFPRIKRQLFNMFGETYHYGNNDMYLTNIVSDYVKKIVDYLHNNGGAIPEFAVIG